MESAHGSFTNLGERLIAKPRATEMFATMTWYVWTHRNKTRLGEKATLLERIGEAAKNYLL